MLGFSLNVAYALRNEMRLKGLAMDKGQMEIDLLITYAEAWSVRFSPDSIPTQLVSQYRPN